MLGHRFAPRDVKAVDAAVDAAFPDFSFLVFGKRASRVVTVRMVPWMSEEPVAHEDVADLTSAIYRCAQQATKRLVLVVITDDQGQIHAYNPLLDYAEILSLANQHGGESGTP